MNIQTERMPMRLNPDHLTDVVTSISYRADYSRNYLEQQIMDNLSRDETVPEITEISIPLREIPKYGTNHYFSNADYRLIVSESQINVNIVSEYKGWDRYKQFINKVLSPIAPEMEFTAASLRYISKHNNVSIFEQLDGTIRLNYLPMFSGSSFVFKCQHRGGDGEYMVETRLSDRIPVRNGEETSIVDIRIYGDTPSPAYTEMMRLLNTMHVGEKMIYFSLLTREFVESMNPEY